MKQQPSQLKFKKYHKFGSSLFFLKEQKKFFLSCGFGLKVVEAGHLTNQQLEACRKVLKRGIFRSKGFFNLDVFCGHPITEKAIASRMGKGKGMFKRWVKIVKKGFILCSLGGVDNHKSLKLLKGLKSKLPVKTKILKLIY
jgi:large subunit ribosomal protein L16